MPTYRRVVALLTGVLLLQFTLVGSGFACATDEVGGSSAIAAMDDVAPMSMGLPDISQTQETTALGAPEATPEPPCGVPAHSEDCRGSSSSEACTAMTSCAPPALGVALTPIAQPVPSRRNAPPECVTPPPARPTAPDHPPPRT